MVRRRNIISRFLDRKKNSLQKIYSGMNKITPLILSKATTRYSSKNNIFVGLEISFKRIKRRFNSVRDAEKYTRFLRKNNRLPNETKPLYYGSRN